MIRECLVHGNRMAGHPQTRCKEALKTSATFRRSSVFTGPIPRKRCGRKSLENKELRNMFRHGSARWVLSIAFSPGMRFHPSCPDDFPGQTAEISGLLRPWNGPTVERNSPRRGAISQGVVKRIGRATGSSRGWKGSPGSKLEARKGRRGAT